MSENRDKVLQLACELFVGLGFAMCQADGALKRDEGRALAKALNQLLDKMKAGKELRDQVPGMLTRASKACARKGGDASADTRLQQLLELGRQFGDGDQRLILESLMEIAESDGEVHDLERALISKIETAWGMLDAASVGGGAPSSASASKGADGEASSGQEILSAAIEVWTTMAVIDGEQEASEIEAALQFVVQLGLLLDMSAEEVVNDDLMEAFIQGGVRAQRGAEAQLESFQQRLGIIAGASHAVRKHVLGGLAVLALKDEKIVPEEAALLAVAQRVLEVGLDEITGEAEPSVKPAAEAPAPTPAASGPVDMNDVELCGPTQRPAHAVTGAPFFNDRELECLGPGGRAIATRLPALGAEVAQRWIRSMEGVGHPMQLQFLDDDVLGDMFASSGERPGPILGVVPRLWLLRMEESETMMAHRRDFKFVPTVLVATCERLYWQVDGAWQSLRYRSSGGETDEAVVARWSELFGRGPFAEFSHEDLGSDASHGDTAHFDLYLIREQNTAQTLYGSPGEDRKQVRTWLDKDAYAAFEAAGELSSAQERQREQMREILKPHFDARKEGGDVLAMRGFYDDTAAMYAFLVPMLLQGGFRAFMPRGLDPHGNEEFRYPTVTFMNPPFAVTDPIGRPLRVHARRGLTLPMFLEPTGQRGGSWMALLLASLRNAWPAIQAGADAEVVAGSTRHRVTSMADIAGAALEAAEQASGPEQAARVQRAAQRAAWAKAMETARARGKSDSWEGEVECLRGLLRDAPDNAEALRALASALRRIDSKDDAVQCAEAAISIDSTARKYWVAALAHYARGDQAAHATCLQKALSCWEDPDELVRVWSWYASWKITTSYGGLPGAFEHATREEVDEALRLSKSCPSNAWDDAVLRFLDVAKSGGITWGFSALQTLLADLVDGGWSEEDEDVLRWPGTDVWFNYVTAAKQDGAPMNEDERRAVLEKAAPAFESDEEHILRQFEKLKRALGP